MLCKVNYLIVNVMYLLMCFISRRLPINAYVVVYLRFAFVHVEKIVNKGGKCVTYQVRLKKNGMDYFHMVWCIDMYYCVILRRLVFELQVLVVLFDVGGSTEDV